MYSQACINLVKKFEGCRLVAYRCPANILTIGWGHTGPDVYEGLKIFPGLAETWLYVDLGKANRAVNQLVSFPLTQGQEDALTSFVFNLGAGRLKQSTLLKLVNSGKMEDAAKEFPKWVYAGKVMLPGLVKRRAAEMALFMEK